MKHPFFGGVHPDSKKEMSASSTDLTAVTPTQVVIPLLQHIGQPCRPLVQAGDRVLSGQKIGDGEGLCVPVHSSVSGTVAAVEPRPHVSGQDILSVVIHNDFKDAPAPPNRPVPDGTGDDILSAIRDAGIVGMGGASFPSDVKALAALGKIDTLIANGCECEPYITADDLLLRTAPRQVLEGMGLLAGVLGPDRVVLAVEDNKPRAVECLRPLMKDFPSIQLSVLPTRYPQGAEKQLVQAVTGREIPPGQLPVSVGCAVFNVSTFAAIYRAARLGAPLTRRIVTVTGEGVRRPQNLLVPIGTPFHEAIRAAGGRKDEGCRVICGGPMMGIAQTDWNVPVVKSTNCILCLPEDPHDRADNPVCLRCGKCVDVCPMRLQPLYLYRYQRSGDLSQLRRLNLADCIECGSCSYICPGKLPLVERLREGKKLLKEARKA